MKLSILLVLWIISAPVFARHFVLVAGLGNEQVSAYFHSFENYLKNRGENHITKVMPSSLYTVSENNLKRTFLDLFEKHREPLVIFAHSKGSLETAVTLATNPEDFPAGIVESIIYVNTPFQGSPYMPESIREFEDQWGRFGNQYNPVYLNAVRVMKCLLTENILALNLTHDSLSDRTYFVRTQQVPEKVSPVLKKSAAFLKDYGPNDGLIPVENQKIENFGHDLGVYKNIDHGDFFVRKWTLDSKEARAMDEILKAIHN